MRSHDTAQNNALMQSLLILVTGEPVPPVQRERGDFAELIRGTVGGSWRGSWMVADARRALPRVVQGDWSGVIITGSPASLTERAPWMQATLMYVRKLVEARVPTLGICFGHQLLGEALGGSVERNPAGREIGTVTLQVNDESPLIPHAVAGVPREVAVNMTHLDSVVRLPEGAKVLGHTPQERHAYVQFGPRAWGVQFHPEMDAGVIRHYIQHRQEELVVEGLDVSQLLAGASETPESYSLLRTFADYCARRGE